MNYYIKGSAAKAEQIKAAFEKLGYDVTGFDICNDNILFFTYKLQTGANVISTTNAHLYTANIIKTHPDYKELELAIEPKFKAGDWIINKFRDICLITDIDLESGYYFCESNRFGNTDGDIDLTDKAFHLWTIADAKDGDILHHSCTASNGTFIFKGVDESGKIFCYCDYDSEDYFCLGKNHHIPCYTDSKFLHPATKEQRELLFKKMKEAGYQWDANKKELRKIQPHYDIKNFHVGMPVLVRADNVCRWDYSVFSRITGNKDWQFAVCNGVSFTQCIPFEGNEHLLGTTDQCDEQYINW